MASMAYLLVEIILPVSHSSSLVIFFRILFRTRIVPFYASRASVFRLHGNVAQFCLSFFIPDPVFDICTAIFQNSKILKLLKIMKISPSQTSSLSFSPSSASHRINKKSVLILTTMSPHCLNYARRHLERCHLLRNLDIKLRPEIRVKIPKLSRASTGWRHEHPFDAPRRKLGRHSHRHLFTRENIVVRSVCVAHLSFVRYRGVTNQLVS